MTAEFRTYLAIIFFLALIFFFVSCVHHCKSCFEECMEENFNVELCEEVCALDEGL